MDISFELYKVFYYVAKTLSFSEAAQQLFISQSAVSQSIKLLESKINCRLFTRNTKQVRLSQEGEILFKHVEQAFNFIKTGERSLSEVSSIKRGEVRLGASDTICKYYLLPFFKQFNRAYPDIKIKVTNRTSPMCIELLQSGSVDIAVVNIPGSNPGKNLKVKKVRTLQDVFIAGKNYVHLKDRPLDLSELQQYPLLMLEKNSTSRVFFESLMEKNRLEVTPEVELGSVDLLIELTKIGLGISFICREYIGGELLKDDLFTLQIKQKIPKRDLGILTNSEIPLPPAAEKFVEMLGST